MMMGITIPDSGRVSLFEKPFDRASLDRVGYLPEERGLYKKMKVLDQLVFFGCLHGLEASEAQKRAVDWAGRMEIADALGRRPKNSPKACSRNPVHRHAAPRTAADSHGRALLRARPRQRLLVEKTLLELKDDGKAILFSTHRMDQVEKLCDSICLINNGRAVLSGKMREIKSRYERNHVIVEFEGNSSFLESAEIAEAKNFSGHA